MDKIGIMHYFLIQVYNVDFGLNYAYYNMFYCLYAAKWMRALRTMPRTNQNTNGAIEAWHLTLKKMIGQKVGDINAMRLDAIIEMLFVTKLLFFHYNLRCKTLGKKINYKKEEIILNNLKMTKFELQDH